MNKLPPTRPRVRMWDLPSGKMFYDQSEVFQCLANIHHCGGKWAYLYDNSVFMLFSGAYDSHNQKIYEGDILEGYDGSEDDVRFQVIIRDYKFVTVDEYGVQFDLCDTDTSRFTKTGDVFQTPQLAVVNVELPFDSAQDDEAEAAQDYGQ